MAIILIINPKGGVGKTTLSTNLAGYFAKNGYNTAIADADPQHSSLGWLALRPLSANPIVGHALDTDKALSKPKNIDYLIVDTPAGVQGWRMRGLLQAADRIIIPLQASIFDMMATEIFLQDIKKEIDMTNQNAKKKIGVVGMRVNSRTHSAYGLNEFIKNMELPIIATLRDTQQYIQIAAEGLSIFEVSKSKVAKDLEQWQAIIEWVAPESSQVRHKKNMDDGCLSVKVTHQKTREH